MISGLSSGDSLMRAAYRRLATYIQLYSSDLSITRIFSWRPEEILTRLLSFSGMNTLRRLNVRHLASFVQRACQSAT